MSATLLGTVERSKNITSSNAGGRPAPQPVRLRRGVRSRRRVRRRLLRLGRLGERHAGHAVDGAQARQQRGDLLLAASCSPCSATAGASIAPRTPLPPPAFAPLEIEPLSEVSVTSVGMAREMSRSACSQSKREAARSLTVWTRVCGQLLEVGVRLQLSGALGCTAAAWAVTASSSAWRSFTVLVVST